MAAHMASEHSLRARGCAIESNTSHQVSSRPASSASGAAAGRAGKEQWWCGLGMRWVLGTALWWGKSWCGPKGSGVHDKTPSVVMFIHPALYIPSPHAPPTHVWRQGWRLSPPGRCQALRRRRCEECCEGVGCVYEQPREN